MTLPLCDKLSTFDGKSCGMRATVASVGQTKVSDPKLFMHLCRAFCATIVSRRALRRSILCTTNAHIVAHTILEQYSHHR